MRLIELVESVRRMVEIFLTFIDGNLMHFNNWEIQIGNMILSSGLKCLLRPGMKIVNGCAID